MGVIKQNDMAYGGISAAEKAKIDKAATDINTLNASKTTPGSVEYKVQSAIDNLQTELYDFILEGTTLKISSKK